MEWLSGTYCFQITLYISNISTATISGIAGWFFHHMVQKAFSVKDAIVNYLEAVDIGALFEDVNGSGRHRAYNKRE